MIIRRPEAVAARIAVVPVLGRKQNAVVPREGVTSIPLKIVRPEASDDQLVVRSDLLYFKLVVAGEGDSRGVVCDLHLQLVPSSVGQPGDDTVYERV